MLAFYLVTGFTLPALPRAAGVAALAAVPAPTVPPLDFGIFADPSPALVGLDMSELETIITASNSREDIGGVVGGSYALAELGLLATGFATLMLINSQLKKQQVPFAAWQAPVSPAAEWMAGLALPSLEELQRACVLVTTASSAHDLVLCANPTGADMCIEDEDFSEYYGVPVFVCRA